MGRGVDSPSLTHVLEEANKSSTLISFPTAKSLSQVEPEVLNEVAGLGYRDEYVHDGKLKGYLMCYHNRPLTK